MADIFDLGEYALRRAAQKGVGHWTGEDGIDWTAETTGPINRTGAAGPAGSGDLCGPGAGGVPADGVDSGPGVAPGRTAGRVGRPDLLGGDEAASRVGEESPEEVTP